MMVVHHVVGFLSHTASTAENEAGDASEWSEGLTWNIADDLGRSHLHKAGALKPLYDRTS